MKSICKYCTWQHIKCRHKHSIVKTLYIETGTNHREFSSANADRPPWKWLHPFDIRNISSQWHTEPTMETSHSPIKLQFIYLSIFNMYEQVQQKQTWKDKETISSQLVQGCVSVRVQGEKHAACAATFVCCFIYLLICNLRACVRTCTCVCAQTRQREERRASTFIVGSAIATQPFSISPLREL